MAIYSTTPPVGQANSPSTHEAINTEVQTDNFLTHNSHLTGHVLSKIDFSKNDKVNPCLGTLARVSRFFRQVVQDIWKKELARKFFDLFYPENSKRLNKEFQPEAVSLDLPGFRKFFLQQADTSEDQIDPF